MSRVALIDGDVLAYRCLAAATTTTYVGIDKTTDEQVFEVLAGVVDGQNGPERAKKLQEEHPNTEVAKVTVEPPLEHVGHLVNEILADLQASYSGARRIFLSAGETFRNQIYAEYKANRPPRPRMLPEVREMLCSHYGAIMSEALEADDEISIAAREIPSCVMVSNDKDLLQIPGVHYDPFGKIERIVDPYEAEINLWIQVLSGDSVDNIKGVPGIGKAKATKYLSGFETHEFPLAAGCLYADSGLCFDTFVLNYRLVKLLEKYGEEKENPEWWDNVQEQFREEDSSGPEAAGSFV